MTVSFSDELYQSATHGTFIVLAGMVLYLVQKSAEKRTSKREMAKILRVEVKRTLNIRPSQERPLIVTAARRMNKMAVFPDNRVYAGLLNTGNIQFFDEQLQDDLNLWYMHMGKLRLDKLDAKLGIRIVDELENMESNNEAFRAKIRVSRIRKLLEYKKFLLTTALLLILASLLHGVVRIASCTYLGLEQITVDWEFGRVLCDVIPIEHYLLVMSVENGIIIAVSAAPIFIKWVWRRRYLRIALFVAMVAQGAHMMIKIFTYEEYGIFDPRYLVLVGYLLVVVLVARNMHQKILLRNPRVS